MDINIKRTRYGGPRIGCVSQHEGRVADPDIRMCNLAIGAHDPFAYLPSKDFLQKLDELCRLGDGEVRGYETTHHDLLNVASPCFQSTPQSVTPARAIQSFVHD